MAVMAVTGSDHPRIRGEHGSTARMSGFRVGSSPHTRGARADEPRHRRRQRIIPAYAGSTTSIASTPPWPRDHPRIRGEHASCCAEMLLAVGSSPHTRGARGRHYRLVRGLRIIPAYAGSTPLLRGLRRRRSDHPRIRGEHLMKYGLVIEAAGSSPHTRGARGQLAGRANDGRIIPAYAGSTNAGRERRRPGRDHPRIRGEHLPQSAMMTYLTGSSPHTRGALRLQMTEFLRMRIIPAYAGSTQARSASPWRWRDHPRIRGEHMAAYRLDLMTHGSSPHTRGAPVGFVGDHALFRIIPAYAGSTFVVSSAARRSMDHPRIRGEHGEIPRKYQP